jgi:hypothetical protein
VSFRYQQEVIPVSKRSLKMQRQKQKFAPATRLMLELQSAADLEVSLKTKTPHRLGLEEAAN